MLHRLSALTMILTSPRQWVHVLKFHWLRTLSYRGLRMVMLLALLSVISPIVMAQTLSFDDMYAGASAEGLILSDTLKNANGTTVTMQGYMAPPLKAESDFFVLTREPMARMSYTSSMSRGLMPMQPCPAVRPKLCGPSAAWIDTWLPRSTYFSGGAAGSAPAAGAIRLSRTRN